MSYYPKAEYNVFNFDINKAKELIIETCENRFENYAEERVKQVIRSLIEYLNHPANVDKTEYCHRFDFFFDKDSSFFEYVKTALEQKGFKVSPFDPRFCTTSSYVNQQYNMIKVSGWAS